MSLLGTLKPERHFATSKVNGVTRNVAYEQLYSYAYNVNQFNVGENTSWIKVLNTNTTNNVTTLLLSDIDLYDGKQYIVHQMSRNPIEIGRQSDKFILLKQGVINSPGFWMVSYSQGTIYASRISTGENLGIERKSIIRTTSTYTVDWDISVVLVNYTGGTATITLPAAGTCRDREITVKNQHGSNNVNIIGITTADDSSISGRGALTAKSDGYTWNVISGYARSLTY